MKKIAGLVLLIIGIAGMIYGFGGYAMKTCAYTSTVKEYDNDCTDMPSITPNITASPSLSSTPSAIPIISITLENTTTQTSVPGNSDATKPHPPTCTIYPQAPTNPWFTRINNTTVQAFWGKSTDEVERQALHYGYTKDNLLYGVIVPVSNESTQSQVIAGLTSNTPIWVKACVYNHGCESCSSVIDP